MTAALRTERLAKRYAKTWALRDCTLSLPQGRVVALVGPNGAGKTTLLHLAVGLISPTEGTVEVFGRPVDGRGSPCGPRSGLSPKTIPSTAASPSPTCCIWDAASTPPGIRPWPNDAWTSWASRWPAAPAGYREASRSRSR
jgi:energy-coupling factor transporter ATP-binding protein EcfA2